MTYIDTWKAPQVSFRKVTTRFSFGGVRMFRPIYFLSDSRGSSVEELLPELVDIPACVSLDGSLFFIVRVNA